MKLLLLAVLAAAPLAAQWDTIEIRFEGIGCASCLESIPSRIGRMRGVKDVKVDAEQSLVTVKLETTNRVRLEQVRDFIEQDGTKATRATVSGRGTIAQEGGRWTFRLPAPNSVYLLEWAPGVEPKPGDHPITGVAESLHPATGNIVINVTTASRAL